MRGASPKLPGRPPDISIVVSTYDRSESLHRCLTALIAQQTTRLVETIVVDNHPQSGMTAAVAAQFPGVRWLREPVPGLSRARNRGIMAAQGAVIVTTDDDVVAPPFWIERLTAPLFENPNQYAATTGNCLPSKVETEAELLFEAYGGLQHGNHPAHYDGQWMSRWRICFPQLWRIGTTANAAFRASLFRDETVGLFETRLGTGTASGAWEDLYCFYKILRAGYAIAYIPNAEVVHSHREEITELTRQIRGYRCGETAFLTLMLARHRDMRAIGQIFLWIPQWLLTLLFQELWRRSKGKRKFSLRLFRAESAAYFAGPWALWRADRVTRQIDRRDAESL